jgi:hypothetical protein
MGRVMTTRIKTTRYNLYDNRGKVTERLFLQESKPNTPETILELAYIADPKVFDRDAQTKRSKARVDLRAQTGNLI